MPKDKVLKNTNIEELQTFFKGCILPRDKNALIQRLTETAEQRLESLLNDRKIVDWSFHLYMVSPDLVGTFKIVHFNIYRIMRSFDYFKGFT